MRRGALAARMIVIVARGSSAISVSCVLAAVTHSSVYNDLRPQRRQQRKSRECDSVETDEPRPAPCRRRTCARQTLQLALDALVDAQPPGDRHYVAAARAAQNIEVVRYRFWFDIQHFLTSLEVEVGVIGVLRGRRGA